MNKNFATVMFVLFLLMLVIIIFSVVSTGQLPKGW